MSAQTTLSFGAVEAIEASLSWHRGLQRILETLAVLAVLAHNKCQQNSLDPANRRVQNAGMEDGIDLIQARRAELRRERARLVESLAAIDAEEKELEITERTLSRLVVGPMKAGVTVAGTPHRAAPGFRAPKRGSRRPDNIPSTPVMINLALIDAEAQGKRGLSAKELLASIAGKWWPGVGTNNILPDAARLVRSGKLSRVDGLYIRVRSEKDSETTAPRPSQDENR